MPLPMHFDTCLYPCTTFKFFTCTLSTLQNHAWFVNQKQCLQNENYDVSCLKWMQTKTTTCITFRNMKCISQRFSKAKCFYINSLLHAYVSKHYWTSSRSSRIPIPHVSLSSPFLGVPFPIYGLGLRILFYFYWGNL